LPGKKTTKEEKVEKSTVVRDPQYRENYIDDKVDEVR
jgi:hypothetical protein